MKSSNIGGQAVLEGIMMRSGDDYAVAVRTTDGKIEVRKDVFKSVAGKADFLLKIPFVRGVFGFIDSLSLGIKTLMMSAEYFDEEEAKPVTEEEKAKKKKEDERFMTLTMIASVFLAIAIFMVLPYFLSMALKPLVASYKLRTVFEGILRIVIFMIYIFAISKMEDIQRTFMYHGAEHKCINCIENGLPLNVENVRKSSRQHKRCGTSFLFLVMAVSVVVLMLVQVESPLMRVVVRILLIPVIAGISFEILKLAGRSDNWLVNLVSKPGLMIQKMTTKEPDDSMIEVAIQAVEAVFDWRSYEEENFGTSKSL